MGFRNQDQQFSDLHRLSLVYSKCSIKFPNKDAFYAVEISKIWFIYFFHDYTEGKPIEKVIQANKTYHDMNVLLCYYNTSNRNHLEMSVKPHYQKEFANPHDILQTILPIRSWITQRVLRREVIPEGPRYPAKIYKGIQES